MAPEWESNLPFSAGIFAGDIVIIEPYLGRMPSMALSSAEWVVNRFLGFNAISEEKKTLGVRWGEEHSLHGYRINANQGRITLPQGKVEGARRLVRISV